MRLSFQTRIRIIIGIIILVSIIILVRLFYIQIIHKNLYIQKADKQYVTPSGNVFNRSSIFFSKKDGSLVTAGTITAGFKVAMRPKDIVDPEAVYSMLSPYMKMDQDTFLSKVLKFKLV